MIIYLPYPDLKKSVECLDEIRLRIQTCQTIPKVLEILERGPTTPGGRPTSKYDHPTVQMWFNHSYFLCELEFAGIKELGMRGIFYPDLFDKLHSLQLTKQDTGPPIWWKDQEVHTSHQRLLVGKDIEYYRKKFQHANPLTSFTYHSPSQKDIIKHGHQYLKAQQTVK